MRPSRSTPLRATRSSSGAAGIGGFIAGRGRALRVLRARDPQRARVAGRRRRAPAFTLVHLRAAAGARTRRTGRTHSACTTTSCSASTAGGATPGVATSRSRAPAERRCSPSRSRPAFGLTHGSVRDASTWPDRLAASSPRSRRTATGRPACTACSTRPRSASRRSPSCTASQPQRVDDVRDARRVGRVHERARARAVHDRRDAVERRSAARAILDGVRAGRARGRARSTPRPTRATAGTTTARSSAPASTAIRGRRRSPPTCSIATHPACAHLGAEWQWHDEVYQFRDLRPDAQVLLRVRDGELDLDAPGARPPVVRLPARVVLHAKATGRVFSTSLGHFPAAWEIAGVPAAPRGRPRLGARRRRERARRATSPTGRTGGSSSRRASTPTRARSTTPTQIRAVARTGARPARRAARAARPSRCRSTSRPPRPSTAATYRRERVVFDTEATMSVPAYLLVPHDRGRARARRCSRSTVTVRARRAICGVDATEDTTKATTYAHALASAGYVVLAPDLRGFGERADWMPDDKYHCDWDLVCATMAGVVPLAAQPLGPAARARRARRAPARRSRRASARRACRTAATCTLFLAAIDERVRAAVVSRLPLVVASRAHAFRGTCAARRSCPASSARSSTSTSRR